MAKTLKSLGLQELDSLRRRARRQQGLGRIGAADAEFIVKRLNEIEARIIEMKEENENGLEERVG